MKNLEKHMAKVLGEHRLDEYLQNLIKTVPWDDLMLAFANVCVFNANSRNVKRDSKEYKSWIKRAKVFHESIINLRTASVQKRKLKKLVGDDCAIAVPAEVNDSGSV